MSVNAGRLKPKTSGVEERLGELAAHGWGAAEVEALRQMITPSDPLKTVDYFFVETQSGRLTRDQVRAFGRPETWTNDITWRARFVSDREVERLKEAAEQHAREAASP